MATKTIDLGSIMGPQGIQGPQGVPGPKGESGVTIDTEISAGSTNATVPSSKCVYDAIYTAINTALKEGV